jgi:hypothetical protein
VSKVQAIESQLRTLSTEEILQVRDWLDNFIEDQLGFTPEFEAQIRESERDMAAGRPSRTRRGPTSQ